MAQDEQRELWWPSPTTELGKVVAVEPAGGFETVHGARLDRIQFSYECWGEPDATRENAVLVVHPLASDPHACGEFAGQARGWWEPLIGPGRAVDTDRTFVVCPNLVGGCYGSTGPRFPGPDGEPWLERFPLLTPLDLMRLQRLFLRQLGVERLRMVVGPSMGGMVAWEWAVEAGDELEHAVVVAAPLATTPLQIGLNWLQRRGIELDLAGDAEAARWGQMIARGVGMLSYRAPAGLDERFGRDWFKKPGATLGDRGMYNIESWLRHHGKKAIKRFDPYTYMLFSRVMDLHDVGAGRGGVVAALERVRCPVTVVGISSDQLYPAAQVQTGVEVLEHLGRSVTWELISSPHGHDAFLLETDQLAAILRGVGRPAARLVPRAASAEVHTARVGVLGAGQVAAAVLRLLAERRRELAERFGVRFEVAVVAEIDPDKRLDPVFAGVELTHDPAALVARGDLDVVLDLTRGSGSSALVETSLRKGRPVVTPNKPLVRERGGALERLAVEHGTRIAFHNSIAAGWPLLYSIESPLARRDDVVGMRALLSATCNVVLEGLERGDSFEAALARARGLELTEPDPDLDLSGWDSAQKLLMLVARSHGTRFDADGVHTRGIVDVEPALVRAAPAAGYRVKLVGLFLDATEPLLAVLPAAVPADGHLGGVHGDGNAVVMTDRGGGEIVLAGKGAGHLPVAAAVLGDLVGVFDARRSWTGRYPRDTRTPRRPEFAGSLVLGPDGSATATEGCEDGAVPLLDSLVQPRDSGAA
jgi:homoserine O-acetyltransferase